MPKGFTLIELLIVVSIIGILSVALMPSITNGPSKARDAVRIAALKDAIAAIETYALDNDGVYPKVNGCVNVVAKDQYKKDPLLATSDYDEIVKPKCGSEADGMHPYFKRLNGAYAIIIPVETKNKATMRYQKLPSIGTGPVSNFNSQSASSLDDDAIALPYAHAVVH